MGLDMYLYGVLSKYNLHDYNIGNIRTFVEIGYWRKSNQIHKWFVDNIQGGVDNCATYYCDKEQLIKLKILCQQVLDDPKQAEELLPVKEGFFFGSEEYDEWYFSDLQETIEIIDWTISKEYDYFAYSSSW